MTLSVNSELIANYAEYYEQEDGLQEWRELGAHDKCSNIVSLCSGLPHGKILEIGCGDGAILRRLMCLGFGGGFTGLEISASAIRKSQSNKPAHFDVRLFDGYEVPFEPACFDLAIVSHVLEHVEYPRKLILEAARVAKNVFIEVPLEDNRRLPDDFVFDRVGHINSYNRKTIRHLVQSCQMKILAASLCNPSKGSYVYRKGKLFGGMTFLAKHLGVRWAPSFASGLFTYNYSLAYTRSAHE